MRIAWLIILAFFSLSCAQQNHEAYPGLAGHGILPLSTTNPYLGANLFLAHEMEQGTYLYNFFQNKGAPIAIEVIREGQNQRLLLFYPKDREVYSAHLARRGEGREWIIQGPYGIERRDYTELARMEMSLIGEPVFMLSGQTQRFNFHHPPSEKQLVQPVLPKTPAPVATPAPARQVKRQPSPAAKTTPTPAPARRPALSYPEDALGFARLNRDQQAILITEGYVERASNGDAIHRVKSSSETLEAIAKWYTGDESKAASVAEANGLQVHGPLNAGMRIRIPVAIATQNRAMK